MNKYVTGHTAFGISFVVLLCACAIALHADYSRDDVGKLGRLKFYCMTTMAIICFHLGIAGYRVEKYYEQDDRFAIISLVNFAVAELFLIYSLICTLATLKKTKDRTPLRNQLTVWIIEIYSQNHIKSSNLHRFELNAFTYLIYSIASSLVISCTLCLW